MAPHTTVAEAVVPDHTRWVKRASANTATEQAPTTFLGSTTVSENRTVGFLPQQLASGSFASSAAIDTCSVAIGVHSLAHCCS